MRPARTRQSSASQLLFGVADGCDTLVACGTSPSAPPSSLHGDPPPRQPRPSPGLAARDTTCVGSIGERSRPARRRRRCRMHLADRVLPWRLDVGLSRAVAFADGGTIVVAGGLTANGTTGDVRRIDVATGRTERHRAACGVRYTMRPARSSAAVSWCSGAVVRSRAQRSRSCRPGRRDGHRKPAGRPRGPLDRRGRGPGLRDRRRLRERPGSADLGDDRWHGRATGRSIADRRPVRGDRRLGRLDLRLRWRDIQRRSQRDPAVRHDDRTDQHRRPTSRPSLPCGLDGARWPDPRDRRYVQ